MININIGKSFSSFVLIQFSFSIKLFLCDFKGRRMVEVRNEVQKEGMREVRRLLLKASV